MKLNKKMKPFPAITDGLMLYLTFRLLTFISVVLSILCLFLVMPVSTFPTFKT